MSGLDDQDDAIASDALYCAGRDTAAAEIARLRARVETLEAVARGLMGQIDKARGSFHFDDAPLNAARSALADARAKETHPAPRSDER